MQSGLQPGEQAGVEARYRVMLIIWAALLASVGVYALIGFVARPAGAGAGGATADPTLLFVFGALGLSTAALSFVVKAALLKQAAVKRDAAGVQTAYIVALAVCESSALFGLVALFVTGDGRSFVLFAVCVACMLLHKPRREHLLAATSGGGGQLGSFGKS